MRIESRRFAWAGIAALAALGFLVAPVAARTDLRVNVNLGGAPACDIAFDREPGLIAVPGGRFSFAGDFGEADVYSAGPWWYAYKEGYWYRSRGWRGPWACLNVRYIPREVVDVGPRYRRWHHMPASYWRNHGWREERREWREERRDDRRDRREVRREDRRDDRRDRREARREDRREDRGRDRHERHGGDRD